MQSLHQERWDNRELPTATKMVEATQRIRASASAMTLGHATRVSANRVWDLRVGRLAYSQETTRALEDATGPGFRNLSTGLMTGAPAQTGEIQQHRWTVKTTFGQFTQGVIGSDHDWKSAHKSRAATTGRCSRSRLAYATRTVPVSQGAPRRLCRPMRADAS